MTTDAATSSADTFDPVVTWTFAGRRRELGLLASTTGDAERGQAVVLRGPAGVGKTSLALMATDGLDPVVVRGTTGIEELSLLAIVPLLARLEVAPDNRRDRADLLFAVGEALDRRADVLHLVVDDAPRLDEFSTIVVRHVVLHPRVSAVLTARDDEVLGEPLDRLVDEGSLVVQTVGPLTEADSAAVLRSAISVPLATGSVELLHEASAGNPLILRELVAGTLEAGGLIDGTEGSVLTAAVPSPRLLDLVSRHFDRLDELGREFVEVVAAGQPLALDAVLGRAVSESALLELERSGLVVVETPGDDLSDPGSVEVRLGHPIYDDVVRATTPTLRWRARQSAAAELLAVQGDPASLFRATCLRVEAGVPVEPDALVTAARHAFGLLDHDTAVRLAVAARDGGAEFWGNLVIGGAESARGDADAASAALLAATAAAVDDEQRAMAAQRLGMHLAVGCEQPAAALDHAEQVLAELTSDVWIRFLAADVAKWRMMSGRTVADLLAGPLRTPDEPLDVVAALNDHVFRALVAVMAGELGEADLAIEAGRPLAIAHPEVLPNAQDLLMLSRFLSMSFAGQLDRAEQFGTTELSGAVARRGEPEGMWSYALGVMDLYRGRCGSAAARAGTAVERLAWRDFTGLRPAARALSAAALAQAGRLAESTRELEQLDPSAMSDPKVDLLVAEALAWTAVHDRQIDAAVSLLAGAGRRAMEAQHLCLGALTSYDAVRLGGATAVVEDLESAASESEGTLLKALAAHASAEVQRDRGALAAVSIELELIGLPIAAADASAQLAKLQRRSGDGESARRAERRAASLSAPFDGPRGTAGSGDEEPVVALTPREREVATLAADRYRSKEISERLGISIRTVDNHLASVFRKLGVVNRTEMSQAMAELGLSEPPRG